MSLLWETVKLIVVLGIVLMVVVYVIRYGFVRLQPGYSQKTGIIKIVERLPVSPKSSLFLITIGESSFLLGVSSDNIQMLAKIKSDELLPSQPGEELFKTYLDKLANDTGSTSYLEKFRKFFRKGNPVGK